MVYTVLGAAIGFLVAFRSPSGGLLAVLLAWVATRCTSAPDTDPRSPYQRLFYAQGGIVALRNELAIAKSQNDWIVPDLARARERVTNLESELAAAQANARKLSEELAHARKSPSATYRSEQEKLYGRLGLCPGIPTAFLPHIKRAVVMTLHPDRHPDSRKAAAQERFVEAMSVLGQILADRGLKAR
ncbi:MAG: hypothetical protein JWM36_2269 [Hyphomicrobiales bacterium]|nr:hypothetical protein [Hyphomicrobiales bacterium]